MRGKFIVLYGVNNIGKTTQANKIIGYLKSNGYKTHYFKIPVYELEPTGAKINKILHSRKQEISENEFQLLYAQNRRDYMPVLKKKIEEGYIVIAEDYIGTGLAWGNVKGASMDYLKKINEGLIKEDFAFLLDGERFLEAKEKVHLHEQNEEMVKKARKKFLELAKEHKWKVINANQSRENVFEDIKKEMDKIIC